jgi:cyclopropane fatty-acyl-phospholipid synthase-like methyltransferase
MTQKPFSQACENNKGPILKVLKSAFADVDEVLEIGTGTGQHAVFFAEHLAHLSWQPSDVAQHLSGIKLWLQDAQLSNINSPVALNVLDEIWPVARAQAVFTANTLHIMGESEVVRFFEKLAEVLAEGGKFCCYGPFNYAGKFSSDSNARFNDWLAMKNPKSAIRDFEWIESLAKAAGLQLVADHEMPANNRLLEWGKTPV